MLTKEFVKEAVVVANFFAEQGKGITPGPNTALSRLVRSQDERLRNAAILGGVDIRGNATMPAGFEADLVVNMLTNTADVSLNEIQETGGFMGVHAEVLDQAVQENKKGLLSIFHVSREVIMPQIKKFHDAVCAAMENNSYGRATRFEVVPSGSMVIYTNPSFRDRVSQYASTNQGALTQFPRFFTQAAPEDLADFVKTGMSSMDEEIDRSLGGNQVLVDLWAAFFVAPGQETVDGYNGSGQAITMAQIAEGPKSDQYMLGLFLLCDAVLRNKIPESVSYVAHNGDPQPTIQQACINARALVGKALYVRTKLLQDTVANRRLIVRYDDYKAYVNEPVYAEFMERGGTQEMILGNLMIRNKAFTLDEILTRGDELSRAWDNGVALMSEEDRKNSLTTQRRVAYEVFREMLKDIAEANPEATAINFNAIVATFLKTYDSLPETELREFHVAATRLICRTLYTDPCFETILMQMFSIKKEQPQASMETVATLAFVNYVGRWLVSQIVVNRRS